MVETSTCVEGHVFTHSDWVGVTLRSPEENLDGLVSGRDFDFGVAAWNQLLRDGGSVMISAAINYSTQCCRWFWYRTMRPVRTF